MASDPLEVMARAICRCFCPCITEERPCYDWEGSLPEARAALAALEAEGYLVFKAQSIPARQSSLSQETRPSLHDRIDALTLALERLERELDKANVEPRAAACP